MSRVQLNGPATSTGLRSHSATWVTPTTTGNLLVAIWSFRTRTTAPATLVPPAGWVYAIGTGGPSAASTTQTNLYYIENAPSRSGAQSFTWTGGTVMDGSVTLMEYSQMATSGVLDVAAQTKGTSSPASTGTTANTTQPKMVYIGGTANNGAGTQTLDSGSGFTLMGRAHSGSAIAGQQVEQLCAEKIVNATGTANFTSMITGQFTSTGGAIATFKQQDGVQYARPSSTVTRGAWTATGTATLHEAINEVGGPSDAEFIVSSTDPARDTCEVALPAVTDPLSSVDHRLRYRYGKSELGGARIDLTVRLRQGSRNIASWFHKDISARVTVTQTLSPTQADSITDYSNLRLRFTAEKF